MTLLLLSHSEGLTMPAVRITSDKQYEKAIEVLTRVGGTWQGVGFEERYLLVSGVQYTALLEAGVAIPSEQEKDRKNRK
jgi:hypothetical protein